MIKGAVIKRVGVIDSTPLIENRLSTAQTPIQNFGYCWRYVFWSAEVNLRCLAKGRKSLSEKSKGVLL
jgi:hypothetical protein